MIGNAPIAFVSRTLITSEWSYAQLEKEALSLIFGIKNFINTSMADDSSWWRIANLSAPFWYWRKAFHLLQWLAYKDGWNYSLHISKKSDTLAHANSDGRSRLMLEMTQLKYFPLRHVFNIVPINPVNFLPVTAVQIMQATRGDLTLSKVLAYTKNGWPTILSNKLKLFHIRNMELTVEGTNLFWEIRVVTTYRNYIATILESEEWKAWPKATSGGLRLTNTSKIW